MNSNQPSPINYPLIFTYTRQQALADGFQIDVSETAREAGIKFPVFLTRTVWNFYVEVPTGVSGQDESGRLWDIVWMLRFAILKSQVGSHPEATVSPLPSTFATTTAKPSS